MIALTRGVLVALLLAVVPVASASAAPKPYVPRGFAYAARVRVAVTYDASFDQSDGRSQVCTDPMSGEQTAVTLQGSESRRAKITAVYGPITVPITTLGRLGRAAASRALIITHTGEVSGRGALTGVSDDYEFSGQGLQYPSCTTSPWTCAGSFVNTAGFQPGLVLHTGADGYDPIALTLGLDSASTANPAVCTGGDQEIDVVSTLEGALASAQVGTQPPWGTAELDRGLTQAFEKLAKTPSVTIVATAPARCYYDGCGAIVTSTRVVLTRLSLERTTRRYRR